MNHTSLSNDAAYLGLTDGIRAGTLPTTKTASHIAAATVPEVIALNMLGTALEHDLYELAETNEKSAARKAVATGAKRLRLSRYGKAAPAPSAVDAAVGKLRDGVGEIVETAKGYGKAVTNEARKGLGKAKDKAKKTIDSGTATAKELADKAQAGAKDLGGRATETAKDLAGKAQAGAKDLGGRALAGANVAKSKVRDFVGSLGKGETAALGGAAGFGGGMTANELLDNDVADAMDELRGRAKAKMASIVDGLDLDETTKAAFNDQLDAALDASELIALAAVNVDVPAVKSAGMLKMLGARGKGFMNALLGKGAPGRVGSKPLNAAAASAYGHGTAHRGKYLAGGASALGVGAGAGIHDALTPDNNVIEQMIQRAYEEGRKSKGFLGLGFGR